MQANIITSSQSLPARIQKDWRFLFPWIIFLTGILYYCFAYLLRVYPSVMAHDLLIRFHANIEDFGWITGFYYIAYAPMQLPVGVTVDRIGARRSLLLGCLLACVGVFLFANTVTYGIALAGRFLIGLGAAFAYVTALKIAAQWLPKQYFATATGFVTGSGMLAAIFTDNYLTHLIHATNLHNALLFPGYVGIVLFCCIFLFIRNKSDMRHATSDDEEGIMATSYPDLLQQLWGIMKMPQMWLIGLVGALLYLPSSVFIDAWAIPYLKTVAGFTAQQAAVGASMTLAGWIISSFATGFLSDRFRSRKIPLLIASSGSAIVFSIILLHPFENHILINTLLFMLGIFCGPHPLCFSLSKENCAHKISGTAVSFANFVIMIGGMFLQPAIGGFLSVLHKHVNNAAAFTHSNGWDFSMALSIIPIGLAIAFFVTLFIKETHGKHDKP